MFEFDFCLPQVFYFILTATTGLNSGLIQSPIIPHICLNYASYLSQSYLIFVSSIPHICLNHASYLSQSYLIFFTSETCGEAIHIESKSYLFLWTNWYFGKFVHLSEMYGKFSKKNSSQFYAPVCADKKDKYKVCLPLSIHSFPIISMFLPSTPWFFLDPQSPVYWKFNSPWCYDVGTQKITLKPSSIFHTLS